MSGRKLQNKYFQIISKFLICHRLPDRTFKFRGHYFPVCSRCTGLYVGVIIFCTCFLFFFIKYSVTLIFMAFIITLPCLIDGSTQYLGFRKSNNELRFITGFAAGFGAAMLIFLNPHIILPSLLVSINLELPTI
jgi:uncharacterized membrane protein